MAHGYEEEGRRRWGVKVKATHHVRMIARIIFPREKTWDEGGSAGLSTGLLCQPREGTFSSPTSAASSLCPRKMPRIDGVGETAWRPAIFPKPSLLPRRASQGLHVNRRDLRPLRVERGAGLPPLDPTTYVGSVSAAEDSQVPPTPAARPVSGRPSGSERERDAGPGRNGELIGHLI